MTRRHAQKKADKRQTASSYTLFVLMAIFLAGCAGIGLRRFSPASSSAAAIGRFFHISPATGDVEWRPLHRKESESTERAGKQNAPPIEI